MFSNLVLKLLLFFYGTKISITSDKPCTINSFEDVVYAVANCDDIVIEDLSVPAGKALDLHLLNGTTVTINGIVTFEYFPWTGPLVRISGNNLRIVGQEGSALHGLGNQYWDGMGTTEKLKPKFVKIEAADSVLKNIHLLDCPIQCVTVQNSNSLLLSGWTVDCSSGEPGTAPPGHEGHNTDGFDVLDSNNITIQNSIIHNQDDCVAVSRGTNLFFSALYCSGSHGLSLSASFSEGGNYDVIENVTFSTSIVVKSRNAIHVKTHTNSAPGSVKNITYKNIQFSGISNYGINIEQDYENGGPTGIPNNNINITQLNLENVHGSVLDASAVPVYIYCGNSSCYDWKWTDVVAKGNQDQINKDRCNFVPDGYICHVNKTQ